MKSCLVDFSDSIDILGCFFKEEQIKPSIVVERVFCYEFFVMISPFAQNHLIDFLLRTVLLFKVYIHLIKLFRLIFGNVPQPKLEYLASPLVLPVLDLELGELNEIILMECL